MLLPIFSQDSKIRWGISRTPVIAHFPRLVSLSVLNACREYVFVFCTDIAIEMWFIESTFEITHFREQF